MIRLFLFLPVVAVVLFAGSSRAALAQSTVISFSPSTTYVAPGSGPFTVDVWVQDLMTRDPCPWPPGGDPCGLGAYELKISFDETVLEYQSFADGGFVTSTGRTPMPCPSTGPDHDPASGVIHKRCATSGVTPDGYPIYGPVGSGLLATITFNPLAEGTSALTFEQTKLLEIDATAIPHSSQDGSVVVAPLADLEVSMTAPGAVTAPP